MRRSAIVAAFIAIVILAAGIFVKGTITQPAIGNWLAAGSMTAARSGAASALLQDGRILISGGDNGAGPVASAEVFDSTGSFVAAPPMGMARSAHSATVLIDGRVLVAGGSTGAAATNAAEIFDPIANAWTPVAGGMIQARSNHTASLLADGRVLFAGGDNAGAATASLEIFDPAANAFSSVGAMSSARASFASAILSDGRVMLTGGSNGSAPVSSTEIFDPVSNTVAAGPALSAPRMGHSATTLLDGRVLVAGGTTVVTNPDGSTSNTDLASAEIYDPATGSFSVSSSSLAAPRRDHSAFLLPNNNSVLIVGGTSSGNEVGTAEIFQPLTGTFAATGSPSVARQHATGTPLSLDGILFLAGGSNSTGSLSTAELYGFTTVKTDKADYAPGSIVTITGSGWQPGETVTLTLVESPFFDSHGPFTAVADSSGKIFNNQFSPDVHDISIRFYLTAVGSVSGYQAQNTFTDANNDGSGSMNVNPTTATAASTGNSFTFAFSTDQGKDLLTGAQVTVVVPAGWTTPQSSSSSTPGFVSITNGNCISASLASISGTGPWTVTININCSKNGQNFTMTYAGGGTKVTVPTVAGLYVFTTQTKQNGGTLTTIGTSPAVTVNAGPATAGNSTVSASPTTVTADGTTTSTITVTLKDANNNLASGRTVTLAKNGGSSTITTVNGTTNASGQATFAVKDTVAEATTYTATDTTDSVTVGGTATVTFVAGTPTAGNSTIGASPASVPADGATTSTITVTLKDANNNPVSGKTVTLAQGTGSSSISAASGASSTGGVVTFTVKDSKAETVTYTATDTTDAITVNTTATVTFTAGAAAKVQVETAANGSGTVVPAQNVTAGSSITVFAIARDAQGNFVSNTATNWSVTNVTGGVVAGDLVASGDSKSATFAGHKAGTATIHPGTSGLTSVDSGTITVVAGAVNAATSTVTANPTSVVADGTTTSTITVTLKDGQNNLVSGKTVTLAQGTGSSSISPGSAVSNASGVAAFTVKDSKAEAVTYAAADTTDSVTITQTAVVTFSPGTPTAGNSTVTANPTSITADGTTTSTITVTLKDANNNAVSGKTVTLAQGTGSSTISVASGLTNASGMVTFTVKDTKAETVTYAATDAADNVIIAQTAQVTFTPGALSQFVFAAITSPQTAGTAFNITITAEDAHNNVLTSYDGNGFKAVLTSSGTLTGTPVTTSSFVKGVLSGFPVTITNTGTFTISAVGSGSNGGSGTSNTFTVNPGAANKLVIVQPPTNTTAGQTITPAVKVQIQDANGNLTASTASVTMAIGTNPSAGTLGGTITQAAVSGVATFGDLSINKAGVGYTLTVASSGLSGATSSSFTVNARTTSTTISPLTATAAVGQGTNFTVTVKDTDSGTASTPVGSVVASSSNGSDAIGSCTLAQSVVGTATCTVTVTPAAPAGAHSISASFTASDSIHGNSSTTTSASLTVINATTTTTVGSSANPSAFGLSVSFTATVTAQQAGLGTPTGTVQFAIDSVNFGSPVTLDGSGSATSGMTSSLSVGSHSITATYTPANGSVFQGSNGSLTQTVNQATQSITVTMHAPASAAYGASFAVAASASSGLAVAITSSGSCSGGGAGSATITMTAGTGTCVVHYNQPGNTNFSAAAEVTDSTNATQLTPAVTVTDPMPTFDGNPKTASAVATGLNNAVVSGSFSFTYDGSGTAPSAAKSSYAVVATFTSSDPNYTSAAGNGFLTIKPAAATASVIDPMPAYDGTPKFATITTNPIGLPVAVTYSLNNNPVVNPTAAGTYNVMVMIADSNYSGGGSGTLTIKQASLVVTAADASRSYGQANPAFTGTLTGVIAGDGITATYASAATTTTAAGVYGPADANAIKPTLSDPNNRLSNYSVTSNNGTLTITAVPLYVVANDKTRAFGAGNPAFDAQYFGLVNGDQPSSLTGTLACTSANASASAGTYAIHCGGLSSVDYAIYFVDGTLTVTDPLSTIAVTPNAPTVTYGGMQQLTAQGTFASTMVRNLANAGGMSYQLHDLSVARAGAAAAEAGGKLYAIGGMASGGAAPSNTVEVYDPMNDGAGWTAAANMGSSRTNARATSAAGRIYVLGGCSDAACTSVLGTAEVYNPSSNAWTAISSTGFTARSNAAAIALNGKIYVAGGKDGSGTALNTVEIYDPQTDSWSTAAPLASTAGPASGGVINGTLYLVSLNGGNAVVQNYTGTTWTTINTPAQAMSDAAAAVLNNVLYVVDGASVHAYDPTNNTWTDKAALNTARLEPEPVAIGNLIYVAGNGASGQSASLEALAGDEASWSSSDTTTATIDQSGKASALKAGSATITATSLIVPSVSGNTLMTVGPVTVTPVVTVNDKKYDGLKSATIASETLTGVLSGDGSAVSLTGGAATFDTKDVGTNKTVTVTGLTLSGSKAFDYVLSSTTATTTASVKAVYVQVTASSATVTYGDAVPTITASYSGFISGEDQTNAEGFVAPNCVTNYTSTSNAGGSYYTRCSAAAATNYQFTYVDGSVTVNKATATINVVPYNVTYDGLPHTATGTATGVAGADLSASLNLTGTTHINAGTYSTDAWTFTGGTNYNDASGTVKDCIKKANAVVVVAPYTVTYDGQAHSATVTSITGVNNESGVTVGTVDVSHTAHTAAGTYSTDYWTFIGTANYNNIASTTITDTINKATAVVVVTPYNVTYNGDPHTATVNSITGVNSETGATVGTVTLNTSHTDAGNYSSDSWSFTGAGNYNDIASTTILDVISKADAMITVNGFSGLYDGIMHGATGSAKGVKNEDLSALLSLGAAFADVPGGTAHWTFAGNNNYKPAAGDATITITQAPSSVAVTCPAGVTYNGMAQSPCSAIVTGVNLSLILAPGYINNTNAGTATASASFAGDTDHTGSGGMANFMISPAPTSTSVSTAPNPSNWGDVVTLTATVSNTNNQALPTGIVSFYSTTAGANCASPGGTALGDVPLTQTSPATAITTTPGLLVGTDTILACYKDNGANPNFVASTSTTSQTVIPAPITTLVPANLSFGNQQGGTASNAQPVTVCNGPSAVAACSNASVSTAALSITSIGFTNSNTNPVYFTQTNTCPIYPSTLAVGNSCVISVQFAPPANTSGIASALVTVTDNNRNVTGSLQSASLTGSGTSSISGVGSLSTYALFATASGCSSVSISGNGTVDSYNGSTNSGNVGTNGNATLSGNPVVNGAIYSPVGGSGNCSSKTMTGLSTSGKALVTGNLKALPGPVNYPLPPTPSPAPPTTTQNISGSCGTVSGCSSASGSKSVNLAPGGYGNLSASGGTTLHLSAGTYNFNSLTLSGNSILYVDSGPVVINLAGALLSTSGAALDLSGGSIVNPTLITSNLQFYYAGSKAFKVSGGTGSYAMVYAPNAAINISGGAHFYGSIIGNTINSSGNTAVHLDAAETAIHTGQIIWFNSSGVNVQGLPNTGSVKLYITNAMITFTANGNPYTLAVPNAVVTFSSSVSSASTTWDAQNNRWSTLIPMSSVKGNATMHSFFDGLAYQLPTDFPGGIQNVTWQAAYSTSTPGLNFNWQWGAAVYNQFPANTTGGAFPSVTTGDYNSAHVNALDNSDPAGTPENEKNYLAFGDMGAGYTGLYAGTTAAVPTIAPLSFSQSSLDFGTVPQGGPSAQLTATLTNNDSVPYTINASNGIQYTGTYAGDFTITNNCPISPNSLAAGGSCTFTVSLAPSALTSGTKETAKIVVNDNANNSPQTVFLKGIVQ